MSLTAIGINEPRVLRAYLWIAYFFIFIFVDAVERYERMIKAIKSCGIDVSYLVCCM